MSKYDSLSATLPLIAMGGALGAVLRYIMGGAVQSAAAVGFPVGTLAVNLLGSFCIGFLIAWLDYRFTLGVPLRTFLVVGVLGGFTTFSTFSLEALLMLQKQSWAELAAYTLMSVCGGMALCALGAMAGRAVS